MGARARPGTQPTLDAIVDAALSAALPSRDTPIRVAVAYSGGADSTALLHAVSVLQARGAVDALALHIHHGLLPAADAWLAHCRVRADELGIAFDSEHVAVDTQAASVEGEARRVRYAALARLCARHRRPVLMTAHHGDDQAETVLVNLARGAGIGGLAATARRRTVDGVLLLRPFIDTGAVALREHVARHGLSYVDDPSNQDRRYTRNAIRHEVMPALRRIAPTIATRLARTAEHAATTQALLDEIGVEDLTTGTGGGADTLDVDRLRTLSAARAANALRVWLARRGLRAPSTAALREMLDQLINASPDAQIALLHESRTLRLYRGRVSIDAGSAPRAGFVALAWNGEPSIDVPAWDGALHFVPTVEAGFDPAALRDGPLALRERRGGERMRTRVDGPARTLKNLYQEAGIAAWQRVRLPLVYLADRLIHAGALGANAAWTRAASTADETLIRLEWRPRTPVVTETPRPRAG